MKLIEEIIDLLSSKEPNLTTALMKTKVLLHKLGEKKLVDWVNSELNGYSDLENIPDYRVLRVVIKGNVSNGFSRYTNHALPLLHLDADLRKHFETHYLKQSVAAIEGYADKDELAISIPLEFCQFISMGLDGGFQVESAWGKCAAGAMKQVLTEVSSRLLDFLLELSEKFPDEMQPSEMKEKSKEVGVSDLFNHTVFGDNTTIVVGDSNTQHIKNKIVKKDFDSLRKVLLDNGLSKNDISDLSNAIVSDGGSLEVAENRLGKNVSDWMATMISKAGSAAWDINIGAAGGLLSSAIAHYYGF
jgi:hypothetical protein